MIRYRISANNCRDNYSFFEVQVRQLFKGDNYSKEETINFFLVGWCTMYICNLNCCRTMYRYSHLVLPNRVVICGFLISISQIRQISVLIGEKSA